MWGPVEKDGRTDKILHSILTWYTPPAVATYIGRTIQHIKFPADQYYVHFYSLVRNAKYAGT